MIDRETADRIFDELAALREGVSDVHAVAARTEERVSGFVSHHEERARKHSDRMTAIEGRTHSIEVWRWVLVGAWLAIPASWLFFSIYGGGKP